MIKRAHSLVFMVICLAVLAAGCSSRDTVAVGLYAPKIAVHDTMTGQELSADDLKGKVLFVNFWASWCPPCREEMPSINALHGDMMHRPDFRMITILYNDSNQNGIAHLKQNGFTFPVFEDRGGTTARKFGITGVPETYIIDKKGVLKRKVIGALDWHSPEEKAFLLTLCSQ